MNTKKNASRTEQNLKSTIASFAVEGITPSKQSLEYCQMRNSGKASCQKEVSSLIEKYTNMARR